MSRKYSDDQIAAMVSAYAGGRKAQDVAAELSVNHFAVLKYARLAGVPIRHASDYAISTESQQRRWQTYRESNSERIAAIAADYAAGQPAKAVAATYGVCYQTVLRYARLEGIPIRRSEGGGRKRSTYHCPACDAMLGSKRVDAFLALKRQDGSVICSS